MSGIIFFKTKNLNRIKNFYIKNLGMKLYLDQKKCIILKHGNLLLGFCQSDRIDSNGTITFFYKTKKEVEKLYKKLKKFVSVDLKVNEYFKIYHFYIKDPEGRDVEIQKFF